MLAASASAAAVLALTPLHAEPDRARGGRIVDERGRQVLLRGVNVNALADYPRQSRFPTVFPLFRRDPERIRALGWNTVRLLVSWSRVEPRPGRYDDRYLDRVAEAVRRFERAGVYTVVDMHQDAWGPTLAARPGQRCPPGERPALGWDGAPGWATLAGDAARCDPGTREFTPAVRAAWGAFWANRRDLQGRYARMWGHVARRFARTAAVAGYDVMNEPNAIGAEEEAALPRLYVRVLREIRRAERGPGRRRHLVLFEPSVVFSAIGRSELRRWTRDRNVVYAPHVYTGGFTNGPITREAFARVRLEARRLGGVPVLSGEWGADPDRAGPRGDGYFLDHQRLQDSFGFSATLWTWRESCGDPHKIGDLRAGRVAEPWGEWEVDCRTNRILGPRRVLMGELRRGYVRAAPGRLAATTWAPRRRVLSAAGRSGRRAGPLVAFVPGAVAGRPVVRGLERPRVLRVPGGRLVVAAPRGGAWRLRVVAR